MRRVPGGVERRRRGVDSNGVDAMVRAPGMVHAVARARRASPRLRVTGGQIVDTVLACIIGLIGRAALAHELHALGAKVSVAGPSITTATITWAVAAVCGEVIVVRWRVRPEGMGAGGTS